MVGLAQMIFTLWMSKKDLGHISSEVNEVFRFSTSVKSASSRFTLSKFDLSSSS